MLSVVIIIIGGCVYLCAPVPLQIILTAINFFIPDSIPLLDEIIMVGGILAKIYWLEDVIDNIIDFISDHKVLCLVIIVIIVAVILYIIIN